MIPQKIGACRCPSKVLELRVVFGFLWFRALGFSEFQGLKTWESG